MEIVVKLEVTPHIIEELAKEVNSFNKNKKTPEPTKESEIYYTVDEVASLLKVAPSTISRHIRTGILNASKPGKSWAISQSNLNKYLKNNE